MAVYTELSHQDIQHFLYSYDLLPLREAHGIRAGIENTNYLLILEDGKKLILTLFEKRVAEHELPFFTGLMEHLAQKSIPSPMPLHAKDATVLQRLKGKPALLVTFLEGKDTTDITIAHMRELGTYTGKLHLAVTDYAEKRSNALAFAGWRELVHKIGSRADEIEPGLTKLLRDELEVLEPAWPDHLPYGVIHADLFPDNVFFDGNKQLTGIIDFYFACNDFFAYEIAICLNSWCFEPDWTFNPEKAREFIGAYNAVRKLSEAELGYLPILARGAALRFLLTRTYDWLFQVKGALVTPKDPKEYIAKLRFHQSIAGYRQYIE